MDMHPSHRSGALAEAGYDPVTRRLRIRFREGHAYDYLAVPRTVVEGVFASEHPWTDWGELIKSTYDYERLG